MADQQCKLPKLQPPLLFHCDCAKVVAIFYQHCSFMQMPRTQTKGRGADAVSEAAWASSLSTSASSQQHASLPQPDRQSPAHVSSQNLAASSRAVQPNSQAGQGQAAMHGEQAGHHGPSRFVPMYAEASLGQAPKPTGQSGHPGQYGHQGQSAAFSSKTVGPAAGMQAQGHGSPWSAQSNAQQRPSAPMHPNPEGKPQAGDSGFADSIMGGPSQARPAPALSTAQQRSVGSAPGKAAQRLMSRQHAHAKGAPVHVAPPANAPNGQTHPSPNGASNWSSGVFTGLSRHMQSLNVHPAHMVCASFDISYGRTPQSEQCR